MGDGPRSNNQKAKSQTLLRKSIGASAFFILSQSSERPERVRRALVLRHYTLQAHLAGVREYGETIGLDVLVEAQPGPALPMMDLSVALRTWSASRRKSSPLSSIRSKA